MKLALIRRQFSVTGGAELYLQRLMDALTRQGHELHLFAEGWKQPPPGASFHSIAVNGSRALRPLRFAEAVKTAPTIHQPRYTLPSRDLGMGGMLTPADRWS